MWLSVEEGGYALLGGGGEEVYVCTLCSSLLYSQHKSFAKPVAGVRWLFLFSGKNLLCQSFAIEIVMKTE